MRHAKIRRWGLATAALAGVLGWATGCGSAITTECEQIAQTQCERCFACPIQGEPQVSGGLLCGLDADTTQARCAEQMLIRCESKSSGREEIEAEFERCQSSWGALTCDALHSAYALDKRPVTQACGKIL